MAHFCLDCIVTIWSGRGRWRFHKKAWLLFFPAEEDVQGSQGANP